MSNSASAELVTPTGLQGPTKSLRELMKRYCFAIWLAVVGVIFFAVVAGFGVRSRSLGLRSRGGEVLTRTEHRAHPGWCLKRSAGSLPRITEGTKRSARA